MKCSTCGKPMKNISSYPDSEPTKVLFCLTRDCPVSSRIRNNKARDEGMTYNEFLRRYLPKTWLEHLKK